MKEMEIKLRVGHSLPFEGVVALYNSVGWSAYTTGDQVDKLQDAIQNSTYVVTAWHGEKLIGLARCLSDDVSIFYLQDILVHPDHQRQGVGRMMLEDCLERFADVRMKVLLTDDEAEQKAFYESLGYRNTKDLTRIPLNAYVQITGLELV